MLVETNGLLRIGLVLDDTRIVPLYEIGQHEPRALWGRWFIDMRVKLLSMIGVHRDVSEISAVVLKEIQELFAAVALHHSLT